MRVQSFLNKGLDRASSQRLTSAAGNWHTEIDLGAVARDLPAEPLHAMQVLYQQRLGHRCLTTARVRIQPSVSVLFHCYHDSWSEGACATPQLRYFSPVGSVAPDAHHRHHQAIQPKNEHRTPPVALRAA